MMYYWHMFKPANISNGTFEMFAGQIPPMISNGTPEGCSI